MSRTAFLNFECKDIPSRSIRNSSNVNRTLHESLSLSGFDLTVKTHLRSCKGQTGNEWIHLKHDVSGACEVLEGARDSEARRGLGEWGSG